MSVTFWVVAILSLSLPTDYQLVGNTTEQVEQDIRQAKHEFRSWKTESGKTLVLSYWEPAPARDGGPAVFANRWPIEVAGQKTEIFEASTFNGTKQNVFAVYFRFEAPESTAVIWGTGFSKEEFEVLIRTANIQRAR